jgi:hypothetical protein
LIALIDDVWVQVDPKLNRIVRTDKHSASSSSSPFSGSSSSFTLTESLDELLTSITAGFLLFNKNELCWTVHPVNPHMSLRSKRGEELRLLLSGQQQASSSSTASFPTEDEKLTIRLEDIQRFTISDMKLTNEKLEKRHSSMLRLTDLNSGKLTSKPFFLSIFAYNQVFKFFPFTQIEAQDLAQALTDLTGLQPFDPQDFVQYVVKKELTELRQKVLKDLLNESSSSSSSSSSSAGPWINHTQPLHKIIHQLTDEQLPQNIVDMERLYHSCRLNPEVTAETLTVVKRLWANSKNKEIVRLKLLTIIERLMDRKVMKASDPTFVSLLSWLAHVETVLDPYKSRQAVRLITALRRKVSSPSLLFLSFPPSSPFFSSLLSRLQRCCNNPSVRSRHTPSPTPSAISISWRSSEGKCSNKSSSPYRLCLAAAVEAEEEEEETKASPLSTRTTTNTTLCCRLVTNPASYRLFLLLLVNSNSSSLLALLSQEEPIWPQLPSLTRQKHRKSAEKKTTCNCTHIARAIQ